MATGGLVGTTVPGTLRPGGFVGRPEFLTALLDALADGIVACDADGALQLFNRTSELWHGLPATPVPTEQLAEHYDLYEGDGTTPLATDRIPLLRVLAGEDVEEQLLVIAPRDGTHRRVRATGRRIIGGDGAVVGAVVAMRDDTERAAAADALASERAQLVLARADQRRLDHLRSLHAATARLLTADTLDAAQHALVDAAMDVLGADAAELAWEAPGEHRRRLTVGTPSGDVLRADVADASHDPRAAPPDTHGATVAVLSVWRDEAWSEDERLLLQQLCVLGAQATRLHRLHHRIAAAESRRLRDELLAAVSHQMQTPLATIVGLVRALDTTDLPADTRADVVGGLRRQARTLRLLVQGFLDHARLAAGQPLCLQLRPLDVRAVVDAVVARHGTHGRIAVTTVRGPVVVQADELRLEQVIGNLVDNAHAYGAGTVEVDVAVRDGHAVVTVRDHGPGLGDDAERFFRAAAQGRSLALDAAGSGIGLHLGRQLVELQGGTLVGRDHVDGGALLELSLPVTSLDR